uniref:RNA-dependent RNA polymerase n=1 Tax=Conifer deltapartitivirus TaxID=2933097 RepID=A0A9C7LLM4_9VIRU|nr:RNA-dependent RNA polymerase [Conifer deltapartitivirus]CAI5383868.1 RNA-dependent RNA polymerase [Conifer deltapartitivirus]
MFRSSASWTYKMDHRFRGERTGLIELGAVSERRSREECEIIVDQYAKEAIDHFVPYNLRRELIGWARSYYTLEGHMAAIMKYGRTKIPEPRDQTWNQVKQMVLTEVRRWPKVRSKSYLNFDEVKWLRSSAAGYGYVGLKGDNDNYSIAKRTAVTIAERLNHDRSYGPVALENSTPDIAFTRTQLSLIKVKRKVRNVWGEAFHYVLLEGLFADPLIEYFIEHRSFYFIGRNPLLAVPALIEEILLGSDYIYMFDWSAFDASVQEWEIRYAFEILETILTFTSSVEEQVWRFLIELFIYRKIACPDGALLIKTMGIPSGSCFTNMIGSITNYVRIQYIFMKLTNNPVQAFTHGDDSLAGVNATQYIQMDTISEFCSQFLWELNASKSDVSNKLENISFLSRTVKEGQNARDELLCLRMLQYPEYPVHDGAISALRAESIYQDSGVTSQYLPQISLFLTRKYGKAHNLPRELARWDLIQYEMLRASVSELL